MNTNFPEAGIKAAQSNLLSLYTKYKNFAFVVPYLSGSQMMLSMLDNINQYLVKQSYDEITIYSCTKDFPIIIPHCALFNMIDVRDHMGPLICVEPIGWQTMISYYDGPKYYYIYDAALFRFIPPPQLEQMRKHPTKYFTRSKEHRKFLKKNFNLDTIESVVPDFEMDKIKEIVYA
jgi:hypothetical protein